MANRRSTVDQTQAAVNLFQQGRFDDAVTLLLQILQANKQNAQAWFLLATIYIQHGELQQAKQAFEQAINSQYQYPEAWNNLGVVLESMENMNGAESCYQKAIEQRPDYANALYNFGHIQQNKRQIDNAIEYYLLALKHKPDYAKAMNNLAMMYQAKGYFEKARQYYNQALMISPKDPEIINNLGFTFYSMHNYGEALEHFHQALKIVPEFSAVFNNIGLVLQATGDYDAAAQYFDRAAKNPQLYAQAMHNRSHLELGRLNFGNGWEFYRHRPSVRENFHAIPEELPEKMENKNILVCKDQGLGDEIFFLRYLPQLPLNNNHISYYTDSKLASVLSRHIPNCQILTNPPDTKAYDYILPVAELPRLLKQFSTNEIPQPIKLQPLQSSVQSINNQLPNNKRINIAVTWQAGVQGDNTLFKRLPPETLGLMLRELDANVLILQRNPSTKDVKALEKGLQRKAFNYAFVNNSMEDMLAMLASVDRYIGVSNTNMHLMASLGKAASVFVPHPPEWRWLTEGRQSPWFPHCLVYRQETSGRWDTALQNCQQDLHDTYNPLNL